INIGPKPVSQVRSDARDRIIWPDPEASESFLVSRVPADVNSEPFEPVGKHSKLITGHFLAVGNQLAVLPVPLAALIDKPARRRQDDHDRADYSCEFSTRPSSQDGLVLLGEKHDGRIGPVGCRNPAGG